MGDVCAFWTAYATPHDGQRFPFIVSLKMLPCSLLVGVTHVNGGGAICRW